MELQGWLTDTGAKIYQFFFGSADKLAFALLIFMVADYITGVCAAIQNKAVSSKVGLVGIAKKVAIFVLVCISHIMDVFLGLNDVLRSATILFYVSNEGISILENVKRLNLPLPEKLESVIEHLADEEKKDE